MAESPNRFGRRPLSGSWSFLFGPTISLSSIREDFDFGKCSRRFRRIYLVRTSDRPGGRQWLLFPIHSPLRLADRATESLSGSQVNTTIAASIASVGFPGNTCLPGGSMEGRTVYENRCGPQRRWEATLLRKAHGHLDTSSRLKAAGAGYPRGLPLSTKHSPTEMACASGGQA